MLAAYLDPHSEAQLPPLGGLLSGLTSRPLFTNSNFRNQFD